MNDKDDLKLIYILKIGTNTRNEGLYEFIFSKDIENVLIDDWCWDISPACDNAVPPTDEYIDKIINLKTKSFELICLHESADREYLHGYHNIHALAYENYNNNNDNYESIFESDNKDNLPLLVFHYGLSLTEIESMLERRNYIIKNDSFVDVQSIKY